MRLASTSLIAMTLAATLLGACARRTDVPISDAGDNDDAICRANGVAPGSSEYASCLKNRDNQRVNAINRADRAQRNLGEYMLNNPSRP
jgi:hypothetical protein